MYEVAILAQVRNRFGSKFKSVIFGDVIPLPSPPCVVPLPPPAMPHLRSATAAVRRTSRAMRLGLVGPDARPPRRPCGGSAAPRPARCPLPGGDAPRRAVQWADTLDDTTSGAVQRRDDDPLTLNDPWAVPAARCSRTLPKALPASGDLPGRLASIEKVLNVIAERLDCPSRASVADCAAPERRDACAGLLPDEWNDHLANETPAAPERLNLLPKETPAAPERQNPCDDLPDKTPTLPRDLTEVLTMLRSVILDVIKQSTFAMTENFDSQLAVALDAFSSLTTRVMELEEMSSTILASFANTQPGRLRLATCDDVPPARPSPSAASGRTPSTASPAPSVTRSPKAATLSSSWAPEASPSSSRTFLSPPARLRVALLRRLAHPLKADFLPTCNSLRLLPQLFTRRASGPIRSAGPWTCGFFKPQTYMYEEFASLAEIRLAQDILNYIKIV